MHTVELFEVAIAAAQRLGYAIRQEWLGGVGGGFCEVRGKRWIFVDMALTAGEQLEQLAEVLRQDPGIYLLDLPEPLRRTLGMRRSA